MFDPMADMDPEVPLLLEPSDVARILGLSASRVKVMADEGHLPLAGRTRRGVRLFLADAVERLRKSRRNEATAREVLAAKP